MERRLVKFEPLKLYITALRKEFVMIIKIVTPDMFVIHSCDYYIAPVNCGAVAGKGLVLEFRNKVPGWVDHYMAACGTKEIRIGTVHVMEETNQPWGVINFPTKVHYSDTTKREWIVRGLEALREMLQKPEYRRTSVMLPMLGCGEGKQDYEIVLPLMEEHLSDLEATVFVSMSPERTELRPKYLTIAGPPDFGKTDDEKQIIEDTIKKAMVNWDQDITQYTGIVSGGVGHTDTFVAGSNYNDGVEQTLAYKLTGKAPLVIKANEVRNGVGAMIHQSSLLCDIGDDVILFKPEGFNNNRLTYMQEWCRNNADQRADDRRAPRRVAIYGDKSMDVTQITKEEDYGL